MLSLRRIENAILTVLALTSVVYWMYTITKTSLDLSDSLTGISDSYFGLKRVLI